MIAISLIEVNAVGRKLAVLPDALNAALLYKSQSLATALTQKVQDNLSGAALAERTGLLKNSIDNSVEETTDGVSASVFVSGDVPYAAIQEYGGTTKAHVIEAVNAKALAFSQGGKQAFFTRVNHPGSDISAHSYLRSSLDDMQDDIVGAMNAALGDSIQS